MVDVFSKEKRSEIMSKIRSKNTQIELLLKKLLTGFEYQPKMFGKPDFINYNKKLVVFLDSCFWHQCPAHSRVPIQNSNYWIPKLKRNVIRAKEVEIAYKNSGWKIIRLWEHELIKNPEKCKTKIKKGFN